MDWIDMFLQETRGISPAPYCLWTAIATIAGVLERRVWTHTDKDPLFPNLYVILTGGPAAGKSLMVNTARNMWAHVDGLHIAPDNPTKATFLDWLEKSARNAAYNNNTELLTYCAMCVGSREFGVLIPKYDPQFMEDLTDLYDSPPRYVAPRRTTKSVTIEKPTVNILAATTPDHLGELLPEGAWGQGFTSRIIFVYGAKETVADRDILAPRRNHDTQVLIDKLREFFTDLCGEFEWQDAARNALNLWYNSGMPPEPTYGRLEHYKGRREVHCMKLAMISAVSAGRGLYVDLIDFERAKQWLLDAEDKMPNVFRAMAMRSDSQLIDDLHYHIYGAWSRAAYKDRRGVPTQALWEFLKVRVPSERIQKVIDAAEAMGVFTKGTYPDEWVPRDMTKKGSV